MLYSTGASATSSPEDDFVLIETAESIASQVSYITAVLREHAPPASTDPLSHPHDAPEMAHSASQCDELCSRPVAVPGLLVCC